MGVWPHFFLEQFDRKKNEWKEVYLYTYDKEKDKYIEVSVWPYNGTHELFTILDLEHALCLDEMPCVVRGLPTNASKTVKEIYNSYGNSDWGFEPKVRYFYLADALLYLNDVPEIPDYDVEWENDEKVYMPNPLGALIDRIDSIINLYDDFWGFEPVRSELRVICWLT